MNSKVMSGGATVARVPHTCTQRYADIMANMLMEREALLPLFAELEWIARKSGADLMVRVTEKINLSCITYHAATAILPT